MSLQSTNKPKTKLPTLPLPRLFLLSSVCLLLANSCGTSVMSGSTSNADIDSEELKTQEKSNALVPPGGISVELKAILKLPAPQAITQILPQYQDKELGSRAKAKLAYILGRLHQRQGDKTSTQDALGLFEEASNLAPLFERAQFHIAQCAQDLGQEKVLRSSLEKIKSQSKVPETIAQADYGLAQSYLRANEIERAKTSFLQIYQQYKETQYALGSAFYLAQFSLDGQDRNQALSYYREYLKGSPDGRFAQDIVSKLKSDNNFSLTASDYNLFAKVYYARGLWQQALSEIKTATNLGSKDLWFEEALCHISLNDRSTAAKLLLDGILKHPNSPDAIDAALTYSKLVTKPEATSLWQKLLTATKEHKAACLWNLARRQEQAQALSYYKQIKDKYPKSTYASESYWWLIWHEIKEGKSAQSLQDCQIAWERYPFTKAGPRFAFWIGKLQERLGHKELAKSAYEKVVAKYGWHYYGFRSKARLNYLRTGKDIGWYVRNNRSHPNTNWQTPNPPALISFDQINQSASPSVSLLCRLCQFDEALELVPADGAKVIKSWLSYQVGSPLEGINVISSYLFGLPEKPGFVTDGGMQASGPYSETLPQNKQLEWQLSYPLLHASTISQEAQRNHIDPFLIHGLIREESRYNHMALSKSKALGLMQLLPSTAYGVAKRIGLQLNNQDDIYIPDNNIKLGSNYLAYLLNRFNGNALLAVAGYNGGPNAMASKLKAFMARDGKDYDVFVEDIPYQETRDYVRKVFGSYWNYESIYGH